MRCDVRVDEGVQRHLVRPSEAHLHLGSGAHSSLAEARDTLPVRTCTHVVHSSSTRTRECWDEKTTTDQGIRNLCVVVCAVMMVLGGVAQAAQEELPSLFRGLTVGDGSPGVRIVLVQPEAFALESGLRAGDHIVEIHGEEISSLESFAAMSHTLRGQQTDVEIIILRGSTRFSTTITLISPTVRKAWGMAFLPDYSLRFVETKAARKYWTDRARDDLQHQRDLEAMGALLNVLHYAPDAYDEALALGETIVKQGDRLWGEGQHTAALGVYQQAVALYGQAAAKPLSRRQWERLTRALQSLLERLHTRTIQMAHIIGIRSMHHVS